MAADQLRPLSTQMYDKIVILKLLCVNIQFFQNSERMFKITVLMVIVTLGKKLSYALRMW